MCPEIETSLYFVCQKHWLKVKKAIQLGYGLIEPGGMFSKYHTAKELEEALTSSSNMYNTCCTENSASLTTNQVSAYYQILGWLAGMIHDEVQLLREFIWGSVERKYRPQEFKNAPDIIITDKHTYLVQAKALLWIYLLKKTTQPSSGFYICCPNILVLLGILNAVDSTGKADFAKVCVGSIS